MIRRCNLPETLRLPGGQVLKPVIGGHLEQKPFLTAVDVTQNGWMTRALARDPELREIDLIIAEARKRGLKYRRVAVLSRNLRGKPDLHGRPYQASQWVFVEVKSV